MPAEHSAPILSGTALILRQTSDLEVLLIKRHADMAFAGNAYVFPGGKAHKEDHDPRWAALCDEVGPSNHAAKISAIRETFEEAGILLARPKANRGVGQPLIRAQTVDILDPLRPAIDRREVSFLETLLKHDLVLALDLLIPFGHWITPDIMPKRFDTHFFLAPLPQGQVARQDGREATEAIWMPPQTALDKEQAGQAKIIFPTRMNLGKLAEASDLKAALQRFKNETVMTITPAISEDAAGQPCLKIPAEAGYIQTTEPIKKVAKGVGMTPQTGR